MTKILSKIVPWLAGAMALVASLNSVSADGVHWPDKKLLPKFARPAATIDCIDASQVSGAEYDLFSSLEGLVNRRQPRIACATTAEEGKLTWLDLHKVNYKMANGYDDLLKYKSEIKGLVVTDPEQPHTLNLATTIAGIKDELICDPKLLGKLTNAPFQFRIVDDLRGRFPDKYAVYGYLYTNYWRQCTHRIFAGMGPAQHGHLRDYLVAMRVATVWLGPGKERDAELLRMFVSEMKPAHGVYMGWWPGEGDGLEFVARYGITVLASDFFCNATVFGGIEHAIRIPEIPPPPPLENKVYVAMILSDGDNVQYMQHAMKKDWENPARGSIPIGWTASPLAVDIDPWMLDHYWTTATTNDCLVSGPSGAGYAHINHWSAANLTSFARVSAPYMKESGLRIITVWDKVNDDVARAFAANCPTLLGLTDQSGKYTKLIAGLQTIRLTPTYTSTVGEMIAGITNAAAGWNGSAPLFIAAQSDVWHLGPAGLVKVAEALDSSEYKLVRPDQLFLLARQKGNVNETNGR
jgi:hypothetical protein